MVNALSNEGVAALVGGTVLYACILQAGCPCPHPEIVGVNEVSFGRREYPRDDLRSVGDHPSWLPCPLYPFQQGSQLCIDGEGAALLGFESSFKLVAGSDFDNGLLKEKGIPLPVSPLQGNSFTWPAPRHEQEQYQRSVAGIVPGSLEGIQDALLLLLGERLNVVLIALSFPLADIRAHPSMLERIPLLTAHLQAALVQRGIHCAIGKILVDLSLPPG